MKRYLATYIGSVSAAEKSKTTIAEETQARGMKAWGEWVANNQGSIVDNGAPLGKTKRVSQDGIKDFENSLTGFVIIEAESHEAAAELFRSHPHFSVFPGESVEIMECLSLPQ